MHIHLQLPHTFRHGHVYIDMHIYMSTVLYIVCFFLMHIVLIYISFHLLIASFQSDDRACNFSKGVHFCSPHLCSVFIKVLFLKFLKCSSLFCWEAQSHVPFWVFPKIVVPQKHLKMIIFSRKTNGCWVPPFMETPFWLIGSNLLQPNRPGKILVAVRRLFSKVTEMDRRLGDGWRAGSWGESWGSNLLVAPGGLLEIRTQGPFKNNQIP